MPEPDLPITAEPRYGAVNAARFAPEDVLRRHFLDTIDLPAPTRAQILQRARGWAAAVRARPGAGGLLDDFLGAYSLSSREGVALMCLAEAALRIPDEPTLDALLRDKLAGADWGHGAAHRGSLFVNASTWALMLTGRVLEWRDDPDTDLLALLRRRLERSGEPVIRAALRQAMRILGEQFVMGRSIDEALARAAGDRHAGYRYSFDMLGEAACTDADAERYCQRYGEAIAAVGQASAARGPIDGPGISVKLSALHPRFEATHYRHSRPVLLARLTRLARDAAAADIGLTIDAEEAARLDMQLDLVAALCADPALAGWQGLGLAVQAYQRRAPAVIDLLGDVAARHRRRLMVRLVKGAYWDTELKLAQQQGFPDYPVFTRKANTDLGWLACARRLFALGERVYPQLATHNAHSIAAVLAMANGRPFELQRLHGMGEALYDRVLTDEAVCCRVYAPVGSHRDLLPYLVRRLLENGANSSFVHRIADADVPVEAVVRDPLEVALGQRSARHPRIPLPRDLFRPDRGNSGGVDLSDPAATAELLQAGEAARMSRPTGIWEAAPIIDGRSASGAMQPVFGPTDRGREIGRVHDAEPALLDQALASAAAAAPDWDRTPADVRAACLERAADLIEARIAEFIALCCDEAGKTVADGIAEVREAADFCRYYAARARERFGKAAELVGPTGERNLLSLHGRGVFACISPWNFPLAIFTGQVAAALAAGNAAVAKPAEQTPLTAALAVRLLHQAGIPPAVLQFLPGDGSTIGAPLVADQRIAGVVFTGSVETARGINRALAERDGPIIPLIAETGGQNAMIVDSSALPEQVIADVLASAFRSAGQRCSALRVLFVQDDIAERILTMLAGGMAELRVGDPADISTDVGPVIDADALRTLRQHAERMDREARLICACELPPETAAGTFFTPRAYEIDALDQLTGEVFGPILHVIRYPADGFDDVIAAINATGFGLTFGVHSRIERTAARLVERVCAGNHYVNRNMIGAVVGVQPFGGEGLSGTGPKAGGPDYLTRFAVERSVAVNTAASGGNAALLSMDEDDVERPD